MNDIQVFHNDNFGKLRSFLDDNGNPWFVAKDVCTALELTDVSTAIRYLDEDEKGTSIVCTLGGPQAMAIINEPGLYSLMLRSRKPEAQTFKRWITHEVIPSIRKTGQYQIDQASKSVATHPGEFTGMMTYISILRQMARQQFYPDRMRAGFLAEAASLLSGYPLDRFMPPEAFCRYPLFN